MLEHGSFGGTGWSGSGSIRAHFEEHHINPIYSPLLIAVLEALLLQGRLRLLIDKKDPRQHPQP
jgi:hypothetical protein